MSEPNKFAQQDFFNQQNMLRSNAEKTEVILFTSRFTKTPNIEKLSFENTVIELTEFVMLVLIYIKTYH